MVGDTVTEEVLVASPKGDIGFGRSGGEETPPDSVIEAVTERSEERFDLAALSPGTLLGMVDFDEDTGEVVEIRWEEPSNVSEAE
ncbi:hypothetical protein ACFQH6_18640 [Halobacteriaceae archaeon GCM10025711]